MAAHALAYKLLTALLYGRHSYLTRHPGGGVTAHSNKIRHAIGLSRTSLLRKHLEELQGMGLLTGVQWHGHYFYARTVPPAEMARVTGDPGTAEGGAELEWPTTQRARDADTGGHNV